MMSGLSSSVQAILGNLKTTFVNGLNKALPPDKRDEMLSKLQDFAANNPKLAAFLATHVVLTGVPILLFIAFSISVLIFSLVTALLISLLASVFFTLFMVGVALLFLVPTLFMTTFTASFVFLWGLGGFYILQRFSAGHTPASDSKSIGEQVNRITGGRTSWLNSEAIQTQEVDYNGLDKLPKAHAEHHNGTSGTADGKAAEREIQKVTEDLRDDSNIQSNRLLAKTSKTAESEGDDASTEESTLTATKETVGGATELA